MGQGCLTRLGNEPFTASAKAAVMSPMQSRTVMVSPSESADVDEHELEYQKVKVHIHERLVDSIDLSMLAHVPEKELTEELRGIAADVIREEASDISENTRERLLDEIFDEVFGLGPLESLMRDDRSATSSSIIRTRFMSNGTAALSPQECSLPMSLT